MTAADGAHGEQRRLQAVAPSRRVVHDPSRLLPLAGACSQVFSIPFLLRTPGGGLWAWARGRSGRHPAWNRPPTSSPSRIRAGILCSPVMPCLRPPLVHAPAGSRQPAARLVGSGAPRARPGSRGLVRRVGHERRVDAVVSAAAAEERGSKSSPDRARPAYCCDRGSGRRGPSRRCLAAAPTRCPRPHPGARAAACRWRRRPAPPWPARACGCRHEGTRHQAVRARERDGEPEERVLDARLKIHAEGVVRAAAADGRKPQRPADLHAGEIRERDLGRTAQVPAGAHVGRARHGLDRRSGSPAAPAGTARRRRAARQAR